MAKHLDFFDPVMLAIDVQRGYTEGNTTDVYRKFLKSGGVSTLTEEQARIQAKKWYNDSHAVDDGLACLKQGRAEFRKAAKNEQDLANLFPYEVLFRVAY